MPYHFSEVEKTSIIKTNEQCRDAANHCYHARVNIFKLLKVNKASLESILTLHVILLAIITEWMKKASFNI